MKTAFCTKREMSTQSETSTKRRQGKAKKIKCLLPDHCSGSSHVHYMNAHSNYWSSDDTFASLGLLLKVPVIQAMMNVSAEATMKY